MRASQAALRDASTDLEALRTQIGAVIGPTEGIAERPADQPILDAWDLALDRYRAACAAYVKEMRGV